MLFMKRSNNGMFEDVREDAFRQRKIDKSSDRLNESIKT